MLHAAVLTRYDVDENSVITFDEFTKMASEINCMPELIVAYMSAFFVNFKVACEERIEQEKLQQSQ